MQLIHLDKKDEEDFVLPSDRLHGPVASSDAFGSIIRDYLEQQDRLFASKYEHIVDYNRRRRMVDGVSDNQGSSQREDGGRIYSSICDPKETEGDISASLSSPICKG